MADTVPFFGVYRVLRSGKLRYVPRSATQNEKLAREIAEDLTRGEVVMSDGSTRHVTAYPHVAQQVIDDQTC